MIHDAIRDHMLSGIFPKKVKTLNVEELKKTEWNNEFENLMRNRLILGAFRYGLLGRDSVKFNVPDYIRVKLARYEETGNLESLVDIANLALVEFTLSDHPLKHFKALDDVKEHAKVKA